MRERERVSLVTDTTVQIGPGTEVTHSLLRHATIGRDCRIINTVIEGHPVWPVLIGNHVTLINCHVRSTGTPNAFRFAGWKVDQRQTVIEDGVTFSNARLVNAAIGAGSQGFGSAVESSRIGAHNHLRNSSNIVCTTTAASCNLGSEVSKTFLLGAGFVSEHGSSYLSLVAPAEYPILTAAGREEVLTQLPNVTNIGAGTVFANYGGEPIPAASLAESSGSAKGTAVVYTSFVCINCRVINRYGQPDWHASPFDLLRRRDLTLLGFGSFVENKLTGRVPAFAYANDLSQRSHKLGWVLAQKPGILLNFVKKMQSVLGDQAGRLQPLVEGTIRLECQLLQEELEGIRPTLYSREQLQEGLGVLSTHLRAGYWAMDESGHWQHSWHFDEPSQQWVCDVG